MASILPATKEEGRAPFTDVTTNHEGKESVSSHGSVRDTGTSQAELVPDHLLGVPLKDCFSENNDTFLLARAWHSNRIIFRFPKAKSFKLIDFQHPLRRVCLAVTTHPLFEIICCFIVFMECVLLVLEDGPVVIEGIFLGCFMIEIMMKCIARGFVLHPHAYLRDIYRAADFAVLIIGLVSFLGVGTSLFKARVILVFRCLKVANFSKLMTAMMRAVEQCVSIMKGVLLMTVFIEVLFALVGLHLFSGKLRSRCVPNEIAQTQNITWMMNAENHYQFESKDLVCGNHLTSVNCPEGYTCVDGVGDNPAGGYANFDSFPGAMLTSFIILNQDNWNDIYHETISAAGSEYVWYFMLQVYIGPYFILSLVLAMVALCYDQQMSFMREPNGTGEMYRSKSSFFSKTLLRVEPIGSCSVPVDSKYQLPSSSSLTSDFMHGWTLTYSRSPHHHCRTHHLQSVWYVRAWLTFVGLHTLVLSSNFCGMNRTTAVIQDSASAVLSGILSVEILVRLSQLKMDTFCHNFWNLFDALLCIIGALRSILSFSPVPFAEIGVYILKIFELLRLVQLARYNNALYKMMVFLAKSSGAILIVILLFVLTVFMSAVVGMYLFKDVELAQGNTFHFRNIGWSMLSVFRIVLGEWIATVLEIMQYPNQGLVYSFFVLVAGKYMVFSLFVGTLINCYNFYNREQDDSEDGSLPTTNSEPTSSVLGYKTSSQKPGLHPKTVRTIVRSSTVEDNNFVMDLFQKKRRTPIHVIGCFFGMFKKLDEEREEGEDEQDKYTTPAVPEPMAIFSITEVEDCCWSMCNRMTICQVSRLRSPLMRLWFWVRLHCRLVQDDSKFYAITMLVVILRMVTLMCQDIYLETHPIKVDFVKYSNIVSTTFFAIELFLKLMGLGLVRYVENYMNLMDLVITAISIAVVMSSSTAVQSFGCLVALKVFPTIIQYEGINIILFALAHSLPGILSVLVISLGIWVVFGVIGFRLFGCIITGCLDTSGNFFDPISIGNKTQCLQLNNTWGRPDLTSFDNMLNSFLSLFQLVTLEHWSDVMVAGVDAVGVDMQPIDKYASYKAIFFVVFIILGCMIMFNLLISVISDKFVELKHKYEYGVGIVLTGAQRNYVSLLRVASSKRPVRVKEMFSNKTFQYISSLGKSQSFSMFRLVLLLVSTLLLAVDHHQQSEVYTRTLRISGLIVCALFLVEISVVLISSDQRLGGSLVFLLDIVGVLLSLAGSVLDVIYMNREPPFNLGLLRIARVFRMLHLVLWLRKVQGVNYVLLTLAKSAAAQKDIIVIMFLVMFIYSVLGVTLFSRHPIGGGISPVENFQTFMLSLITLFRLSTISDWNLTVASLTGSNCTSKLCTNQLLPSIYVISFILIVGYLLTNVYIAVVLQVFDIVRQQADGGVSESDIDVFYEQWLSFDPFATQYIFFNDLSHFIDSLPPPLRVPRPNYDFLRSAEIPVRERAKVHAFDVLRELILRAVGGETEVGTSKDLQKVLGKLDTRLRYLFPARRRFHVVDNTRDRVENQNRYALLLQALFRKHVLRLLLFHLVNRHRLTDPVVEQLQRHASRIMIFIWRYKPPMLD